MFIISLILLITLPLFVIGWTFYKKLPAKNVTGYSLVTALVIGALLQAQFSAHPHVPGSDFILVALSVVVTAIVLLLVYAYRYIAAKAKPSDEQNNKPR